VRIVFIVGMVVVLAMDRNPMRRRVLHATHTQECEATLEPVRTDETAMREKPMEAEINSQYAEDIESCQHHNDPCPTEEPGDHCERGDQMNGKETVDVVLLPSHQTRVERGQPAENITQLLSAHRSTPLR
jgi:hypothetical protein